MAKVFQTIGNKVKAHPYASAGIGIGAMYGLYKLGRMVFGNSRDDEEDYVPMTEDEARIDEFDDGKNED